MVNVILISLATINVLSNVWYSIIVPFLPIQLEKHGIDTALFGYIFAMYSISWMISSLIVGKILIIFGRKSVLVTGILWMGISMAAFASVAYLTDKTMIIVFTMVWRCIQGISSSMIQTTSYAVISILYTNNQEKYLGIIEASSALGCLVGPVVGSLFYELIGFAGTFYIIGGIFIIIFPILLKVIPSTVDTKEEFNISENSDSVEEISVGVTYLKLFWNKNYTMSALAAFWAYFNYWYLEPVLALRLMEFDLSPTVIGLFFWIPALSYMVSCFWVSWFTSRFDPKLVIAAGMGLWGLSQFLVGPSEILPNSLVIMVAGQFIFAFLSIMFLIPSLPVMINEGNSQFPNQSAKVTDMSSGAFNFILMLGTTTSVIYSSYMTKEFGFRNCADSVGVLTLSYSIIYLIFWVITPHSKPRLSNTKKENDWCEPLIE